MSRPAARKRKIDLVNFEVSKSWAFAPAVNHENERRCKAAFKSPRGIIEADLFMLPVDIKFKRGSGLLNYVSNIARTGAEVKIPVKKDPPSGGSRPPAWQGFYKM
jgi:hypothetical protein